MEDLISCDEGVLVRERKGQRKVGRMRMISGTQKSVREKKKEGRTEEGKK